MLRKIIHIDESKCDGCGDCVPSCHEGAIQIIDEKARLISDLFCDGLGACLGHCPHGAITIEEREAEPYNERRVMEYVTTGGNNVIKAHLKHLLDHKELDYYNEAINFLNENDIENPLEQDKVMPVKNDACGCPGSREMSIEIEKDPSAEEGKRKSYLRQWPIQMHLVSPFAPYYRNSHLLLTADCVGFTCPDFHKDFLNGKSIAIACPKLDTNQQVYSEKLTAMIKESNLQSITVLIMQVPCCSGLLQLAQDAVNQSGKEIPVKVIVVGIQGEILQETDLVYQ
jgi:ferredoxin